MTLRLVLLLSFAAALGCFTACNLADKPAGNLLTLAVDDSLSAYDTLRIDILRADGTPYLEKVWYAKYVPDSDHKIKDLDIGSNPPSDYQILITGYRDTVRALVYSVTVTEKGAEGPHVLIREPAADTQPKPTEVLPNRIALITPTPLTLSTDGPALSILAQVQPAAASQALLFSISGDSVAEVDGAGRIMPLHAGEADILVRSQRDPGVFALIHVKVAEPIQVKGIHLSPDSLAIRKGGAPVRLTAAVEPAEAGVSVVFSSADAKVASVSSDGTVTAVSEGETLINAYPQGHPSLGLSCRVKVLPESVVVQRDTVAPNPPSFTAETSPEIVNSAYASPVRWVWTRTGAPSDFFLVTLDGGDPKRQSASSFTLANPADRVHILDVREADSSGNVSASVSFAIQVDRVAPPAPIVSGDANSGSASWQWGPAEGSDGARVYRFRLDDGSVYSMESDATFFTPAGLAPGEHRMYVQERDQAGNWSMESSFALIAP
jgi:hypothetical protein